MRGVKDRRSMVLFSSENKTLIKAHSVNDAYVLGLNEVKEMGTLMHNEEKTVKNLHNVSFIIHPVYNEKENLKHFKKRVYCESRNLTNKIQDAEFIWYMTHNPSLEFINQYNRNWIKYSDNGVTVNSNYGSIWVTQIYGIIKKLIFDKYTRQAVIQLYNGDMTNDSTSLDVQCTQALDFKIIPNSVGVDELHMTVSMRSNDCVLGMPIDMFCFASLHELVYNEIRNFHEGLELGTYVHNTSSLHVYSSDFEIMRRGFVKMSPEREAGKDKNEFFQPYCGYSTFWVYKPKHVFERVDFKNAEGFIINGDQYTQFNFIHSVVDQFVESNSNKFEIQEIMPAVMKTIEFLESRGWTLPTTGMDEMEVFDTFYDAQKYSGSRIMASTFITNVIMSGDLDHYKLHFDRIKTYTPHHLPITKYDVELAILNI